MNSKLLLVLKSILFFACVILNNGAFAQPSNDNITGATTLSVSVSSASSFSPIYTTVNISATATASAVPAPGCGGTLANIKDIWYKCTIPSTGKLVVSTKASTTSALTDVAMALYSGTTASPVLLTCANDRMAGSDKFADIAIDTLTPGSTVYIRLWSISTATPNTGNVEIATYSYGPYCAKGNPVPNDSVSKAPSICNLDGFWGVTWTSSGTWPNKYTNAADPAVANISSSGFTLENNSWLKFAANDDTVKLDVYIYSCTRQNTTTAGPQIAIMSKSGSTYSPVGNIINPGSGPSNFNNTKQSLLIPGLTIGSTYYVMFDGYAGDLCHYNIIATKGVLTVDAGADTTACSGASFNRTGTSVSGVTIKWYADKAHTVLLSNTATLSVSNVTSTTTYYMDAIASLTCPIAADDSFKVVVNPAPTITGTTPNSICGSGTIQLGATASSGTINWYANSTGGPSLGSGTTWTTPSISSTTTYYAEATNGSCPGASRTAVIATVTPNNSITLSSAVGTNNQSLCVNSGITNITYNTTGATGANFSGLPNGVNGSWAFDVVTITGTPTVAGTYPYTITLTGGCGSITANGTITVNSYPIPALGPDMTICASVPTTLTAYDGGTYSWSGGTTNSTLNIAPNTTSTYTVTVTKNGCATTEDITVNVSSSLVPNIISTLPTVCAGGSTTIGVDISGATYNWDTGANTQSISVTPATNTTYRVTVTDANGCSGTQSVAIAVQASIAVTSTPETICIGSNATLTAGTDITQTYAWAHSASTSNQVIVSPSATTTYTVTATKGVCTATGQFVVNVNQLPTVSAGSNVTICSGANTTLHATGGVSYLWNTGTGQDQTVSPIVATTYTVTVTDGNGCKNNASVSVAITPINTIQLTSASGTDNQTICNNSSFTSITYATTGATGGSATNLPTGLNGVWNSDVFTISGTPTQSGTFNYTVSLTGGCGTVSATGTINVTDNNTINLTSAVNTDNQTVCINNATTNITYATTGATGGNATNLPTGLNGVWNANVFTISGTPTQSGAFNYTVNLTGGCGTVSTTGTINVTANNTINLTSAVNTDDQTICNNTAITSITYATTGATGGNATNLPSGLNGVWNSDVFTISGTPTQTGVFNYIVHLTGGCGTITANGTITIISNNQISLSSAVGSDNQTSCLNTPITDITYTTTGATGGNATGLPPGLNGVWNSDLFTISGTPTQSGTFNYTVNLTGGCGTVSATGTITISSLPTVSLTSNIATETQTICLTEAITNIVYTVGNGATGANVTGVPTGVIGTYSNGTFTISGTPSSSGIYNYTVTTTGGCSPSATESGSISVVLLASPTIISDPQNICIGSSISLSIVGGPLYNWSNGAVGPEITLTPTTTTPVDVFVTATDNNGCTSTSSIQITANPLPVVSLGSDSAGCISNITLEVPNTFATYLWSTSSISNQIIANEPGSYSVTVTDNNGCMASDTINFIDSCEISIFIPNSFTPNGDNINDYFRVLSKNISKMEVFIFNRWGEEIFSSSEVDFKWDGKFKDNICPVGTYFFILKYYDQDNHENIKTGSVNIIR